jgi:threonine synthase
MMEAIKNTNGLVISVSELEIISAWKLIANQGFLIEPTSAATIAGILKFKNLYETDDLIVSLFSGSGLKSIDKIAKILKPEICNKS